MKVKGQNGAIHIAQLAATIKKQSTAAEPVVTLCSKCKKHPAEDEAVLCKICHKKYAKAAVAFRKKARKAGKCPICGKYPPDPGFKSCGHCREKIRKEYAANIASGICSMCKNNPILIGETRCQQCAEKQNKAMHEHKQKLHAQDICIGCEKSKTQNGE